MGVTLKMQGVETFEAAQIQVRNYPAALQVRLMGNGFIAAARIVSKRLAALVPRRTGFLSVSPQTSRYTIRLGSVKIPGGGVVIYYGSYLAYYAKFLEFGTKRITRRGYLAQAIKDTKKAQGAAFVKGVKRGIRNLNRQIEQDRVPAVVRRLAGTKPIPRGG